MNFKYLLAVLLGIVTLLGAVPTWAAHPLITDDTGTQGKGKAQLEVNSQYDSDEETIEGLRVKTTGWQLASTLSYGLTDAIDLVLTLPYQWNKEKDDNITISKENGIADMVFETKWRFYEKGSLSIALKPGLIIPTGDDDKGLGAGRFGYQFYLIASKEMAPWAFHVNLGYIRNENKADEQKSIWHASAAVTFDVIEKLKLVGNVGIERNTDDSANNDPAFILGGLIYSITEKLDLDIGAKYGLNGAETEWSLMGGITIRF